VGSFLFLNHIVFPKILSIAAGGKRSSRVRRPFIPPFSAPFWWPLRIPSFASSLASAAYLSPFFRHWVFDSRTLSLLQFVCARLNWGATTRPLSAGIGRSFTSRIITRSKNIAGRHRLISLAFRLLQGPSFGSHPKKGKSYRFWIKPIWSKALGLTCQKHWRKYRYTGRSQRRRAPTFLIPSTPSQDIPLLVVVWSPTADHHIVMRVI
jgi:hypothetical protein